MAKQQPLQTLHRRSLESRAADELRAAIISRGYAPGTRLVEAQLSEMMGISRGTVRSALQKLHTEGLIAQRPYSSWEVTGLSSADAWELFTLRGALEGLAAELVAEAIGSGQLDPSAIKDAFQELGTACDKGDVAAANAADYDFHKVVVESANHRRLLMQYQRVDAQIQMLIIAGNEAPDTVAQLVEEHRPLVEALLAGQSELAGRTFRIHSVEAGRETIERMRAIDAQTSP